jgi:hypothetical protein
MALWAAVFAAAVWCVPQICKTNNALPSRYLNQVVVRVGRSEKSAFLTVAGLHVEVQLTSGSTQ